MACLTARVILSCLLRCSLPIRPDPPHTRSASRDLLALETTGPPISPFLISPSTQAFPFHTNTEGGGAQRAPPPASPAKVQLLGGGNEPAAQANDGGYAAARAKFRSATVAPPSALLARVAAFLPQLASANARLDAAISVGGEAARQKVSIEHVEDEDKQHIEMVSGGMGIQGANRSSLHDCDR
jgi:hypothetical protein